MQGEAKVMSWNGSCDVGVQGATEESKELIRGHKEPSQSPRLGEGLTLRAESPQVALLSILNVLRATA